MLAPTLVLLVVAGIAAGSKPLEGVDPNTLSCDPDGQRYLLLPHCTDCAKFLMCTHGKEVLFTCSGGLVFDFELQGCNWQWDAKCLLREHGPGCGDGGGSGEESGESSPEVTEPPAPETTPGSAETSEENSTSEETTTSASQETSSAETSTPDSSESGEESAETTPESVETTPAAETSSEEGSGSHESTTEAITTSESEEASGEEASTPSSEEGSGWEIEGSGQGEVEWNGGSGSEEFIADGPSNAEPVDVSYVPILPVLPIQPIASSEVDEIIAEHFQPANLDCGDPASAYRAVAYDGDCQRYWRCVNGVAETAYCVDGMFFNERSQQCDFESNVVCSTRNNELDNEFIVLS